MYSVMFWIFVGKELKSIIRDPKIIIAMFVVPLIVIVILFVVVGYGIQQQITQAARESGIVAAIDLDNSTYSHRFISFLEWIGIDVKLMNRSFYSNISRALELAGTKILYIIPQGFGENISNFRTASIKIYVKIASLTIGESGIIDLAMRLVERFSENVTASIALERGIPAAFIRSAVAREPYIIIHNRIAENPYTISTLLSLSSFFIPLIVLMLIVMASQLIVTSIAIEKEEKMFETLLSLPISRMSIVGAKLFVSILISIVYMVAYGLTLFGYIFQILGIGMDVNTLEVPQALSVLILQKDLALSLILNSVGLAILMIMVSLVLGIFAEDVRTAQALIGNIMGPLIVLAYIPMFIDISGANQLQRLTLSLIPIANTVFIPKLAIINDLTSMYIAALSNMVYGVVLLLFIRRIVNSETIFTMKLRRFRRHREYTKM